MDSWPVHCVADTPGAQFHPALSAALGSPVHECVDAVLRKGERAAAYSAFEAVTSIGDRLGEPLGDLLVRNRISRVDVVGIASSHCVAATALDAARAGFAVQVLTALTVGVTLEAEAAAFTRMRAAGVRLI